MSTLVDVETVKQARGIDNTSHDEELARILPMVETFVEKYTRRRFAKATYTEYYSPYWGAVSLLTRHFPVLSITSLHDDPLWTYGPAALLTPNVDYVLHAPERGEIDLLNRTFAGGFRSVKLVYEAGYAKCPKDLEGAIIELVWLVRSKGENVLYGVRQRTIADGNITTYNMSLPGDVGPILDLYADPAKEHGLGG